MKEEKAKQQDLKDSVEVSNEDKPEKGNDRREKLEKYGFEPDQKVPLNANKYIMMLRQIMSYLTIKETTQSHFIGDNVAETRLNRHLTTTPFGLECMEYLDEIDRDFERLIDEGHATLLSDLEINQKGK